MSKNKTSILDRIAEALEKLAEQVEELNTMAYMLATEELTRNADLADLIATLKFKLDMPIPVKIELESFSEAITKEVESKLPAKAEAPLEVFREPLAEVE